MRILFSLLACIVFLQSQVYALSGGPNYSTATGQLYVVGTYAGVLTPVGTEFTAASNSLGIFNVGLPASGFAGGIIYIFQEGSTFQGNLQGVTSGDANNKFSGVANLSRVVSAISTVNAAGTTISTSLTYDALASGKVDAKIVDTGIAGTAFRIQGTSIITIQYKPGAPEYVSDGNNSASTTYTVDGYKQTATASVSSSNAVF